LSRKIAVIGVGNSLRRDDGIGVMILESLLKFYKREGIDYLNFATASFDLINRIKDYNRILLIDGINADLSAGELKIFKLEDIKWDPKAASASTHELNLKDLFELSKNLGLKTKVYVAGIQVENTSFGEGLTEALENRKEDIVKQISVFIDETLI
jgi:hydrogenase maturation protease